MMITGHRSLNAVQVGLVEFKLWWQVGISVLLASDKVPVGSGYKEPQAQTQVQHPKMEAFTENILK